jgi:hypothetical protein
MNRLVAGGGYFAVLLAAEARWPLTITIGVPAFRTPADMALPRLLLLPFVRQPDTTRLPDGTAPARVPARTRALAA